MAFVSNKKKLPAPPLPAVRQFVHLLTNLASSMPNLRRGGRGDFLQDLSFDQDGRQLYRECGWPETPTLDQYLRLIQRNGLADRAAHVYADESWSAFPEVYEDENVSKETKFEKTLAEINPLGRLWTYCHFSDRKSCEGRYGGMFLGVSDVSKTEDLKNPVSGFMPRRGRPAGNVELLYLRPLHEGEIEILETEARLNNPRFGQPTYYNIRFHGYHTNDYDTRPNQSNVSPARVHWSRVIHLCPTNPGEAYGPYYLDTVLNYLLDAQKVGGSSAEMFWKGGFPGWAFEGYKELAGQVEIDEESVRDELEAFMNGLKRYLASSGGSWKSLAPNVADPTPHMMTQVMLIAAAIRCPVRILMGSESGHLASTQDILNWNSRVQDRRSKYLNVFVIRQLIERLIGFGILPRPSAYYVAWPDLNLRTSLDGAEEAMKKSQALMQYMSSDAWMMVRPLEYLTMFMSFSVKQANAIIRRAGGEDVILKTIKQLKSKETKSKPQGGGTNGNPPKNTPNRPKNKIIRKG